MDTPTVSPVEYNAFLKAVEPRGVRLSRASIDVPRRTRSEKLQAAANLGEARYEAIPNGFLVWQSLSFAGSYEGDEEPTIRIEVELEAFYSSKAEMTDELFEPFQSVNLPINLWPYFREFVHQTLVRAEWPAFLLPAFRSHFGRNASDVALTAASGEPVARKRRTGRQARKTKGHDQVPD